MPLEVRPRPVCLVPGGEGLDGVHEEEQTRVRVSPDGEQGAEEVCATAPGELGALREAPRAVDDRPHHQEASGRGEQQRGLPRPEASW